MLYSNRTPKMFGAVDTSCLAVLSHSVLFDCLISISVLLFPVFRKHIKFLHMPRSIPSRFLSHSTSIIFNVCITARVLLQPMFCYIPCSTHPMFYTSHVLSHPMFYHTPCSTHSMFYHTPCSITPHVLSHPMFYHIHVLSHPMKYHTPCSITSLLPITPHIHSPMLYTQERETKNNPAPNITKSSPHLLPELNMVLRYLLNCQSPT